MGSEIKLPTVTEIKDLEAELLLLLRDLEKAKQKMKTMQNRIIAIHLVLITNYELNQSKDTNDIIMYRHEMAAALYNLVNQ